LTVRTTRCRRWSTRKFYEVTNQIVLTSHLVDLNYIAFSKAVWDKLTPEQQATVQKAADDAAESGRQAQLKKEEELVSFLREKGLDIYEPDLNAFRDPCAGAICRQLNSRPAGPKACSTRSTRSATDLPGLSRRHGGPDMTSIVKWFLRGAEIVAATMMAAMFLTFILQIAIRYSAKLEWLAEAVSDPRAEPLRLDAGIVPGAVGLDRLLGCGLRGARARSCHLRSLSRRPRQSGAPLVRSWPAAAVCGGLIWSVEPTWSKFFILRLKKTATLNGLFGDWIRMRDIYSIYILFWCVAARYGWRFISAFRHGAPDDRPARTRRGPRNVTGMTRHEFRGLACLLTLFFWRGSARPSPIRSSSPPWSTLALAARTSARRQGLMDGLYQSFILLAVPLFIVAANIMNAGTISDRLLQFCVAAVGRFRGGLGHVNVVASLIFSGMSGSAVADAAGSARSSSR
jgi:C4-dicarboxylate transporter DctQ subunit